MMCTNPQGPLVLLILALVAMFCIGVVTMKAIEAIRTVQENGPEHLQELKEGEDG